MLTHMNKTITMGQRRSLHNALSSVWTMREGLLVQVPENLDRLCELVIKIAAVDVVELDALPISEQTEQLIVLASTLSKGLSGEASGA